MAFTGNSCPVAPRAPGCDPSDLARAESGEEALAQLASAGFDLVLLGVRLPGISRFENQDKLPADQIDRPNQIEQHIAHCAAAVAARR